MSKAIAPRRVRVESGIYRRPDGAYEIGWRDAQGKQRWKKVDGRLKAARSALAEEHARRGRGERVARDPRLTFARAAEAWWDARVVKLRENSQDAYAASLRHLRAEWSTCRMTDITAADVARYVSAKQAAGLKGWTIKSHTKALSAVFVFAARHLGLVAPNPVTLLDQVERPCDEKPKRILNPNELARLLTAVDPAYSLMFDLAAETGGRLSEVLGLAWDNIDLDEQTVAFTHQLSKAKRNRPARRVPLKTRASRRILEVTPALIHKLRTHKIASTHSQPHDLVFVTRTGTGNCHGRVGRRVLPRAVRSAGLEAIRDASGDVIVHAPTFHSLRHSHASALIAQGWDIAEVSARLGHASIATTQDTYVHQFDAARRSSDRRSRLTTLYSSPMEASMEATADSSPQHTETPTTDNARHNGQNAALRHRPQPA